MPGRRRRASWLAADGRTPVVDIHCHFTSQRAEDFAKPHFSVEKEPTLLFASACTRSINLAQRDALREPLTSAARRLADMDRMGIDVQVVSPTPTQYYYWLEAELGLQAARMINDDIAGLVAHEPARLRGLGTVPLQNVEFAVAELRRCVEGLGFAGVEISSNVNGEELASERLRPFFAAAEDLNALLFLHPLGFTQGQRLSDHYLNNVIGNPLEATIAVSHLIFSGRLEQHPGLKICVAHGGGYLPGYTGRMDHAFAARDDCRQHISRPPSAYLRRLYFDTVVYEPEHVAAMVKKFGSDRILLGTDYPFDMGEEDPLALIDGAEGLSPQDRAALAGGNAMALLHRHG